jgi:hypothetical protein
VKLSENEKCCGQKLKTKSKYIFYVEGIFSENLYEILPKNIIQPDRPQITIKYGWVGR